MAAIVYHGLQSHLESHIVESRTLRLRLPSPKPLPSLSQQQPIDLSFKSCLWDSNFKTHHEVNNNNNMDTNTPLSTNPNNKSGWSILEALSYVSTKEPSSQYVHPQQNRSSIVLSPRSLELCTENLGSESGSDIVENDIDMHMLSSSCIETREQKKPSNSLAFKKGKAMNFPPPLTTIRGSESLRLRPHREDGRLVIEVTKASPMSSSCFHAERSHGCLRLRFLDNHIPCFDSEEEDEEKKEDKKEDVDDVNYGSSTSAGNTVKELGPIILDEAGFDEEFESEMDGKMQDVEEEKDVVVDDDVNYQNFTCIEDTTKDELGRISLKDEGFDGEFESEMNGQMQDVEQGEEEEEEAKEDDDVDVVGCECECETRMEKYGRPRRCKEGGEHENIELLLNWGEPLWVVTS
ncbi:hypothetical protein RIF29_22859 [Crotalaria pallida]|uniref:FAF domain-containing protein n=1 Tax=Crotalaria pallida TaxID=3830 RepID=A0AAN9F5I6_CROPI